MRLPGKQIRNKSIGTDKLTDAALLALGNSDPIIFTTNPALNVTEGEPYTDANQNEWTKALISLSDIGLEQGVISEIIVYSKDEGSDSYQEFSRKRLDTGGSTLSWSKDFIITKKPDVRDFKVVFYSINGSPAYADEDVILEVFDYQVGFTGVPDIYEYVEIPEMYTTSTEDQKTGQLEANEIDLVFTDITKQAAEDKLKLEADRLFPMNLIDAFGDPITVTKEMAERSTRNVLYMFISDNGEGPSNPFPGLTSAYNGPMFDETEWDFYDIHSKDPNGTWVFVGEFASPNVLGVRVPADKTLYFWGGFKTTTTNTNVEAQESY